MRVVLISPAPWDAGGRQRRLAEELVRQGLVAQLTVVEPPRWVRRGPPPRTPEPGIQLLRRSPALPRALGGLADLGRRLRRELLADADLLWIAEPRLGARCLPSPVPAVYDVVDPGRPGADPTGAATLRQRRAQGRAQARLATTVGLLARSAVLAEDWRQHFAGTPVVVPDGVDLPAAGPPRPITPRGPGPHLGYLGPLDTRVLDLPLVTRLLRWPGVGTVHLIGEDRLSPALRRRLCTLANLAVEGPVPPEELPSWLAAMDVLVNPLRIDEVTLGRDSTEAFRQVAGGRPVVATATGGFQHAGAGVTVVADHRFCDAAVAAARTPPPAPPHPPAYYGWPSRAREFWAAALRVATVTPPAPPARPPSRPTEPAAGRRPESGHEADILGPQG